MSNFEVINRSRRTLDCSSSTLNSLVVHRRPKGMIAFSVAVSSLAGILLPNKDPTLARIEEEEEDVVDIFPSSQEPAGVGPWERRTVN